MEHNMFFGILIFVVVMEMGLGTNLQGEIEDDLEYNNQKLDEFGTILSEIRSDAKQIAVQTRQHQSTISDIAAIKTSLALLRLESQKSNTCPNPCPKSPSCPNCSCGTPFLANPPPARCSEYDAANEFIPYSEIAESLNDGKTFKGDSFCKIAVFGKENIGRGDQNGCFFPLNTSEIFVRTQIGCYLLRKPTAVKLEYKFIDLKNASNPVNELRKHNAINVATPPNRLNGYVGVCNEGIPNQMPANGGRFPIRGYLSSNDGLRRMIYTYGYQAYFCDSFSILTCVDL